MSIPLRQLFLNHVAQTSPFPVMLEAESASGIYITDVSGKKYIDFISGIAVSNVGHRHPKVVEAIENQLKKYMHLMVYGEYVQSPQVKLAEKLAQHLPANLSSVYFTNSGAEANDGAMKLAKRATGRTEIVYFEKAYHGSTTGALSVMGDEFFKQAYRPLLPDCKMIAFNNLKQLTSITSNTAAVIVETIQGEAGAIVPDLCFIQQLRKRCDETGALLIFDEVQCGFGRTGKLWAFEHFGVVPDILTLSKGMGGGLPIGAFIASKELMNLLTHNPILGHITTFGGNAICCAASLATLTVIVEEQLFDRAAELEKVIKKRFENHPKLSKIRGKGLMLAIPFENQTENFKVVENCFKQKLITDWFLFADHCLRVAPPLIISDQELFDSLEIIENSIFSK